MTQGGDASRRSSAAGPGLGDLLFDVVCLGGGWAKPSAGSAGRSARQRRSCGSDSTDSPCTTGWHRGDGRLGWIEVWRSALDSAPDAAA